MAKANRLSALEVQRQTKTGRYHDGGGLYLQVTKSQTKSWLFRFMLDGQPRQMGLGPFPEVSLAQVRDRATEARRQVRDHVDPIETRNAERQRKRLAASKAISFAEAARRCHAARSPHWRNPKHAKQWLRTLETYAFPTMGGVPVQAVDLGYVLGVLEPIWMTKAETAGRVRQRIETVLDWAKTRGFRVGENPARWKGHLDTVLGTSSRVQCHHAALSVEEIGLFVSKLRKQEGTASKALELLILTATRTSEVLGARWDEIDLATAVWTVPAGRMKAGREHKVPLSSTAVRLLEPLRKAGQTGLVFPGAKPSRPLSNMAMLKLLQRMGYRVTAHGFRSTFRDWAAEKTSHPREVAEMALAHTVESKVERAYRRGDLFLKRKVMMEDWARYCGTPLQPSQVVSFDAVVERDQKKIVVTPKA